MRRLYWAMVLGLVFGCKSADKRKDGFGADPTLRGAFNDKDEMVIGVPRDLLGLVPQSQSSQATLQPQAQVSGLGLAGGSFFGNRPETSKGVESVIVKCFTQDSAFIAKNWHFYAELTVGGSLVKAHSQSNVDRCNEMQIALKTLEKNTLYEVRAGYYWQSPDKRHTIVWYEGKTPPFKPRDENRTLVLKKLRQDQVLNVDVEKSNKDRCKLKKHLWNGQRCIDTFNSISFVFSDFTDYADPTAPDVRKCLHVEPNQIARQRKCAYSSAQRFKPEIHAVEHVEGVRENKEYGWFRLLVDTGAADGSSTHCLTSVHNPVKGLDAPLLESQPCELKETEVGDRFNAKRGVNERVVVATVPSRDQLFTLVRVLAGDEGGRDSFRIKNTGHDGSAHCLSVPPVRGDISHAAPLSDGAPVKMTPCNTQEPNIKRSQYIKFVNRND